MPGKDQILYYLKQLPNYQVASGYCDVRGWEVRDSNLKTVGKVLGLLVNKQSERVLYLDVQMDESLTEESREAYKAGIYNTLDETINKNGTGHVIVPIGLVTIDESNKKVITEKNCYSTFSKTTPTGTGYEVNIHNELKVLRYYTKEKSEVDNRFFLLKEFYNNLHRKHA